MAFYGFALNVMRNVMKGLTGMNSIDKNTKAAISKLLKKLEDINKLYSLLDANGLYDGSGESVLGKVIGNFDHADIILDLVGIPEDGSLIRVPEDNQIVKFDREGYKDEVIEYLDFDTDNVDGLIDKLLSYIDGVEVINEKMDN
jgi:hypothetical protein